MILSAAYTDNRGVHYELEGESLEELHEQLREIDEHAPTVRVFDDPGFLRGWVSGGDWRPN